MRAQVLKAFGGPENFQLTEIPKPEVRPGMVLIRLAATSVNAVDLKIRGGLPIGPELPAVLGADVAGTIEAVGSGVIDFVPGDEVYGCAGGVKGHGGALAEYMLADARLIAPKPARLSMREAAALPLVAITAWDGFERSQLSAADHVLVHGGVGGVGHFAVQLAKATGARVATTVSSREAAEMARSLGADETINYREEKVEAYVDRLTAGRGFDVVFDTVGGDNLKASFTAAAATGRVIAISARSTQD
jgi:NADPH:quinone reductase